MTDKELLELAAKAAGIEIKWIEIDGQIDGYDVNGDPIILKGWNPLTDDGDALRLAIRLDMFWENLELFDMYFDNRLEDKMEATRRAIVRAAAEIGKTL